MLNPNFDPRAKHKVRVLRSDYVPKHKDFNLNGDMLTKEVKTGTKEAFESLFNGWFVVAMTATVITFGKILAQ